MSAGGGAGVLPVQLQKLRSKTSDRGVVDQGGGGDGAGQREEIRSGGVLQIVGGGDGGYGRTDPVRRHYRAHIDQPGPHPLEPLVQPKRPRLTALRFLHATIQTDNQLFLLLIQLTLLLPSPIANQHVLLILHALPHQKQLYSGSDPILD